jgi:hypothetical protein
MAEPHNSRQAPAGALPPTRQPGPHCARWRRSLDLAASGTSLQRVMVFAGADPSFQGLVLMSATSTPPKISRHTEHRENRPNQSETSGASSEKPLGYRLCVLGGVSCHVW